VRYAHVK